MSIARTVASFYWQLTGVINQDIPLDREGEPVEFARYVGYFIDGRAQFQGELSDILKNMALATYLDAIRADEEPRAAIRRASRKASALARHTSNTHAATLQKLISPEVNTDVAQALLLDHGDALAHHLIPQLSSAQRAQLRDTLHTSVRIGSPRAVPARATDQVQACSDMLEEWLTVLMNKPSQALKTLTRELMALPRLVPTIWFAIANIMAYVWIMTDTIGQIDTGWGALALATSMLGFIWLGDVLTYAVHLERDGWGDSPETRAFQDHHDFPQEVALWTVRRSVGAVGHGILILLLLLILWPPHFTIAAGSATALMAFLFATQSHRWAHTPVQELPRWARVLQGLRIILPVHVHAAHHDHLDRSWGIFNGWSNVLLDYVGYHAKYTRLRARLFGETRPLWESQRAARGLPH